MGFSLSLPIVGQPHSTEDPKVGNDLTTISTWANGNIVDTDLNSPNNSYRKFLFWSYAGVPAATAAGTYLLTGGNVQALTGTSFAIPVWGGDVGYSSQPQDFQVANKSAFARLRVSVLTNTVAPGVTFTFQLSPITALGGTSGLISLTLGAAVGSVAIATPGAQNFVGAESTQFALPATATGYVMTVVTSGGTTPANSVTMLNATLFGYNA